MSKILIATSCFDTGLPEIAALKEAGYDVVLNPHARRLTESEIAGLLGPGIIGVIAGLEPWTEQVMAAGGDLRAIVRCGAGMDNVDLQAAQKRGIAVLSTPEAPAAAVAELTIGLIFALLRQIPAQDRAIRAGNWERPMGALLGAQTLGLIGLGRIGQAVARHAFGFGASLIACDPGVKAPPPGVKLTGAEEVLKTADIISLHMPLTAENRHFIDKNRLALMKPGAYLVNTARGELVDEAAVASALKSGQLSGAAFDVYAQEPYKGPLSGLETAVLTAHTGSYARETRANQEREAAAHMLAALTGSREGKTSHG